MKRHRIDLAAIANYNNLALATWKAARNKRQRSDVIDFISHLDQNLQQLSYDILAANAPYGDYRQFVIHDPKTRIIHAACFPDRVLHHAIMNLAEPVLERALIYHTYACRPNKGVHRLATQVQAYCRSYPWYVKMDIQHYFENIDHAILIKLLQHRFKGHDFLQLLTRIIRSHDPQSHKGLPIGSLTSQHFANYYLDRADRFLIEHPQVCAYVRYMDDMVFWCHDKQTAKQLQQQFQTYLWDKRQLLLKKTLQINRSQRGISYCGYRILPHTIRLTKRKCQRYQTLRRHWEYQYQQGYISDVQCQQAYDSIHAITLHADSHGFRQNNLQHHPPIDI